LLAALMLFSLFQALFGEEKYHFWSSTTQQQSPPGYAEITCFEGDPCEPSFSTGILDGCCF